ncbi:MAG: amino acid ABC transporter permease [Oscillospiraceae bacterium]|jgi:polar amino acid transport system permease protein|nr:amino acid ABC transporter permease [Oscillospiraceae bacterium]
MLQRVTVTLLEGFGQNCVIFFVTLLAALPLGLVMTFGSMSKFRPLRYFVKTFIWLIRGTPLMLQLFIVFYVPGLVFNAPFRNRMAAALIAFIINYAAYFSEIYRGAIEGIPKGQYEAGQVLGLSKMKTFFNVVLFQVVRRVTAPIGNEVITLIKDTAIARVIAIPEMIMSASEFTSNGLVWPLFYTGVFFLIATAILTFIFDKLELRLSFADRKE